MIVELVELVAAKVVELIAVEVREVVVLITAAASSPSSSWGRSAVLRGPSRIGAAQGCTRAEAAIRAEGMWVRRGSMGSPVAGRLGTVAAVDVKSSVVAI